MKFERARMAANKEAFADALYDDLAEQMEKLPLERFCSRGGWPVNAKITTIAILEDRPQKLLVVLYIGLTESAAACCSGENFEHERFGELVLSIDRTNWSCEFPAPA